jgi:hypothetical protein
MSKASEGRLGIGMCGRPGNDIVGSAKSNAGSGMLMSNEIDGMLGSGNFGSEGSERVGRLQLTGRAAFEPQRSFS